MSGLTRSFDRRRIVLAALVLAAGELVGAWLAAGAEPGWRLVAAPLVVALAIVGAGWVLRPLGGRRVVRIAVFLAVTTLAAAALVAERHPEDLHALLPVLGASTGGAVVVLSSAARRDEGREETC